MKHFAAGEPNQRLLLETLSITYLLLPQIYKEPEGAEQILGKPCQHTGFCTNQRSPRTKSHRTAAIGNVIDRGQAEPNPALFEIAAICENILARSADSADAPRSILSAKILPYDSHAIPSANVSRETIFHRETLFAQAKLQNFR